jgi:7,8-dihydroneopterin aldolase/epimerase/oxygenase
VTDAIHVQELELFAKIGVPEEERAAPQRLAVNLTLYPARSFSGLDDAVENTVDYFVATRAVKEFASQRECQLIETLAEEIARLLLERFPLIAVEVELRKFILPDTAYVAVKLRRECQQ